MEKTRTFSFYFEYNDNKNESVVSFIIFVILYKM